MPDAKQTRSIVADFNGVYNTDLFESMIAASSIATVFSHTNSMGDLVDTHFVGDISEAELTTFNTLVTDLALKCKKIEKVHAIDARTDELISLGFTYAGKQFSLALTAQSKMTGTHQVKDNPALVYPINWNTIDDADVYAITDAADLDAFYLTGLGTIRASLDSGTALKDSVRAAITVAEVDAVVDNR
jgi:hypothetical protein